MRVFCIGDIFGRPGRTAIKELLPIIIKEESIDVVIANAENAAGGRGLTCDTANELFQSPIDVMTAGNHIWEHEEIHQYFESHNVLRPLNIERQMPGRGWLTFKYNGVKIAVVSLQGEIYMSGKGEKPTNPFKAIEALLPKIYEQTNIIIIDMHAEATSEKRAMAWFLDGRVTALVGTHTHVQTADEEVMPKGMAYISDLGMTGPHDSVIGLDVATAFKRFLEGEQKGFKVASGGVRLEGMIIDVDVLSGKALTVKRLQRRIVC